MKIKKYRDDTFITIHLSYVELVRLSRILGEGVDILKFKGKDLPIDYKFKPVVDKYLDTIIY